MRYLEFRSMYLVVVVNNIVIYNKPSQNPLLPLKKFSAKYIVNMQHHMCIYNGLKNTSHNKRIVITEFFTSQCLRNSFQLETRQLLHTGVGLDHTETYYGKLVPRLHSGK